MRLYFVCMGSILKAFHSTARHLGELTALENVSYSVSDRRYSLEYLAKHAPLHPDSDVLKVWELVERGRKRRPTPADLAEWETRLGIPSLWPAIVADRRTYNGRLTKFKQDYAPYLTLEEMQGIVIETLEGFWAAFERVRPEVVISFLPAHYDGVLAFWVARAQGIPYLFLRSTKIGNYIKLGSDPFERQDPYIEKRYQALLGNLKDDEPGVAKAREYLATARGGRVTYEGGLLRRKNDSVLLALARTALYAPPMLAKDLLRWLRRAPFDMHEYPATAVMAAQNVGHAARRKAAQRALKPRLRSPQELAAGAPYVFYPMHTEPEIAISVFAPYYLNQIEAVRNIAQSLPMGHLLVVKEHPRSYGLRPGSYYRKLAEIPNVVFAHPDEPAAPFIQQARAVVTLSSFVGFEAAVAGVPVVVLGNTNITLLPETMVRRVGALEDLPGALQAAMNDYAPDEDALTALVAALISESVPVNLWSGLLAKAGRETGTGAEGAERDMEDQYRTLAEYLLMRLQDPQLGEYQVKP